MKTILTVVLFIFATELIAVCNTPLSRTNILPGEIPTSTRYNADFNNLYTRANDFPGDCIADGTIQTAQIEDGAITGDKIANATITSIKFASGVIPSYTRPLRIRAFTVSSTWVKQSDVGSVLVQVVGGGGASGHQTYGAVTAGSNSSFGGHCVANGGGASAITNNDNSFGVGGSASNGDLNIQGGNGTRISVQEWGYRAGTSGISMIGHFGKGGRAFYSGTQFSGGGGGSGGYCAKKILRENLSDTETVTIGAGGTWANAAQHIRATSGIVLVYEYAQ